MTNSHETHDHEKSGGVSRRTVVKGAAWAAPVLAYATVVPAASASLLPCVSDVGTTGGTYPVALSLSGCNTASSHWDFRIRITAAERNGTDCDCDAFRVTMFDNPKRSHLWIQGGALDPDPDWSGSTNNYPRLYVQKELAPGATATFPDTGNPINRVAGGTNFTNFVTGGSFVGNTEASGQANDSLHVLFNANGSVPLPCSATGPMAYYRVECRKGNTYTQLGLDGEINPCVPMIAATMCSLGNNAYRLRVTVLTACGVLPTNFKVTSVYRNNDTNFPNSGGSTIYSNAGLPLSAGTTNIDVSGGNGGQMWVSFNVGDGNTSIIRVPVDNTGC